MVHQWDKTSIEANQSPPWGFRISAPPIAGTFGLINYYGIFLISFITGWCLIFWQMKALVLLMIFLCLKATLLCVFNSALGKSLSWIIWRFLDFDQIGAIGKFY